MEALILGAMLGIVGYFVGSEIKNVMPMSNSKKLKIKKSLVKYVEMKRNEDMKKYPSLYRNADEWNKRSLEYTTDHFMKFRSLCMKEVKEKEKNKEFYNYIEQSDPTVLESRIKELEKENQQLQIEQDRNFENYR